MMKEEVRWAIQTARVELMAVQETLKVILARLQAELDR